MFDCFVFLNISTKIKHNFKLICYKRSNLKDKIFFSINNILYNINQSLKDFEFQQIESIKPNQKQKKIFLAILFLFYF